MKPIVRSAILVLAVLAAPAFASGQPGQFAQTGKGLEDPYPNGDRVPDFSFCGYRASEAPLPDVPAAVRVPLRAGDATARIQKAIDYVASLPPDKEGFRGAVQLEAGSYRVEGSLVIGASGVVLRGSGCAAGGTELVGAGTERETLIRIAGKTSPSKGRPVEIADGYVPLGSTQIGLAPGHGFKAGDRVVVVRRSTAGWIEMLGCDKIGRHVNHNFLFWAPGDFDLKWERTVTAATPAGITLDVPLTNSIDVKYGGGYVASLQWNGRVANAGVENLACRSEYDTANPKDENHRWMAITLEGAEDCWVRRVVARNFVSSAVAVWETARRVTVEDCKSLGPVGEIGGMRRYSFQTLGQQTLFQRCYAEGGYHDFTVGFTASGPNAFVQCWSSLPVRFSGAVGGWANGMLMDRVTVDGGELSVAWRDVDGQGGGWSGANCMFWMCQAAKLHLPAPPGAYNWALGTKGQGYGDGENNHDTRPLPFGSLYYSQLKARTGKKSPEVDKIYAYNRNIEATPEFAALMSTRARKPDIPMDVWIDSMIALHPIAASADGVKSIDEINFSVPVPAKAAVSEITIRDGVALRADGRAATGRMTRSSLWKGDTRPGNLANPSYDLVRFVPGRTGRGLTEGLDSLAAEMVRRGVLSVNHFPQLWYDRRRDDHGTVRRADAEVWAPFYEQPFSRCGIGEAYDRLSRYDLTRWNPWYWNRLKEFASIADRNGLLLVEDHYLQHNIIEAGAHWMDYPWRTANNVNDLGFPEPAYLSGGHRVFMADQFYDVNNNAKLREFHRRYIRKCLDETAGSRNVLHMQAMEFTGPLHFMRFWLGEIDAWERETGHDAKVMLSSTKDVQDAILADPAYNRLVDVIKIHQWQVRPDGTFYEPPGGVSLAYRQYERIMNTGGGSFDGTYRAVSQYRKAYPGKAVYYTFPYANFPEVEWASFVAGGSFASIPVKEAAFLTAAARMTPSDAVTRYGEQWGMGKSGVGYIVFCASGKFTADLGGDKTSYKVRWFDPVTGKQIGKETSAKGGVLSLASPAQGAAVMWLSVK